jgi:protein-tyrosine phosphatase
MGLFFFNRSSKKSNYDFGTIGLDMHSHLIPGVDDGAKDPDDSVQLIAELKELGFNHLITTPHTLQDIHPNNMQTLKNGHSLLEGKIPGEIAFVFRILSR